MAYNSYVLQFNSFFFYFCYKNLLIRLKQIFNNINVILLEYIRNNIISIRDVFNL